MKFVLLLAGMAFCIFAIVVLIVQLVVVWKAWRRYEEAGKREAETLRAQHEGGLRDTGPE